MSTGRPAIHVARISGVPAGLMRTLEERLGGIFGTDAYPHRVSFNPEFAYDHSREQFNSTLLLEALHRELPDGNAKLVGVTDVDLFVPVFTFVFGEAQLNGRVAVASLFRLRNGFYGLPEDDNLLAERLLKEVVHELGHTFGLVHCLSPRCVMHASPAVEEVDIKESTLCRECRTAVGLVD